MPLAADQCTPTTPLDLCSTGAGPVSCTSAAWASIAFTDTLDS